jgi:hypothetical protein
MAQENLTLNTLVESIMGSLSDAQDQIERQTIEDLGEWFDEDGRPVMVNFKVPTPYPNQTGQPDPGVINERELSVPLLTLMQRNPIKIKKLIAKFEISLSGVQSNDEAVNDDSNPETRKRKILSADLFTGGGKAKQNRTNASIEIEFESGEPTEAYLKLQNELLKLI